MKQIKARILHLIVIHSYSLGKILMLKNQVKRISLFGLPDMIMAPYLQLSAV